MSTLVSLEIVSQVAISQCIKDVNQSKKKKKAPKKTKGELPHYLNICLNISNRTLANFF